MNTIAVPKEEYEKLEKEVLLLSDSQFLTKVNNLIDLLYESRHGLFMHDFYEDLTEYSINEGWKDEPSPWDTI
jgi:hypothetical protein